MPALPLIRGPERWVWFVCRSAHCDHILSIPFAQEITAYLLQFGVEVCEKLKRGLVHLEKYHADGLRKDPVEDGAYFHAAARAPLVCPVTYN